MAIQNQSTLQAKHNAVQNILTGMKREAEARRKRAQDLTGAAAVEADSANVARVTVAAFAALCHLMPETEARAMAQALGKRASNGHTSAGKTELGNQ